MRDAVTDLIKSVRTSDWGPFGEDEPLADCYGMERFGDDLDCCDLEGALADNGVYYASPEDFMLMREAQELGDDDSLEVHNADSADVNEEFDREEEYSLYYGGLDSDCFLHSEERRLDDLDAHGDLLGRPLPERDPTWAARQPLKSWKYDGRSKRDRFWKSSRHPDSEAKLDPRIGVARRPKQRGRKLRYVCDTRIPEQDIHPYLDEPLIERMEVVCEPVSINASTVYLLFTRVDISLFYSSR